MRQLIALALCAGGLAAQGPWYFIHHGDVQNYDHMPVSNPNPYGAWLLDQMVYGSAFLTPPPLYISQSGDFSAHASLEEFQSQRARFDGTNLPWGACVGNHDYANERKEPGALANWITAIGATHKVDVVATPEGDVAFAHLPWLPDDDDVAWLIGWIDQNPHTPVIVNTHDWLTRAPGQLPDIRLPPNTAIRHTWSAGGGVGDNSPAKLWDKLIGLCPSIFMVTCGHACNIAWRQDTSRLGTSVFQLMSNWQCEPWGGNGFQHGLAFNGNVLTLSCFSFTYHINAYGFDWTLAEQIALPESVAQIRARLVAEPIWRTRAATDAWVYSQWGGGGTRCTTHEVQCATGSDWQEVGLLRFDLTGAHQPSTALLQLAVEVYQGDSAHGFSMHVALRDMGTCPSWASLGGLVAGVDYEAVPCYSEPVTSHGVLTIDVTDSVKAWLDGAPNYGWVFRGGGSDAMRFASSEHPQVGDRPILVLR